jgi:hypothetical protein
MAFTRRPSIVLLPLALALLSLLASGGTLAATGPGDIAVFWGRKKAEGTLREACDTGTYTTAIISFLRGFGHGTYTLDLSGHPLAGVGDDVKHCQSKGILVLLSIGGPGGGSPSRPRSRRPTSPRTCGTPSSAAPAPDYAARSATRRWTASTSTSMIRPAAATATTTTSWPGACTRTTVATAAGLG